MRKPFFESDCENPDAVDAFIHGRLEVQRLPVVTAKTFTGNDFLNLSIILKKALFCNFFVRA
ncbi:MAG: hypothetical protein LBU32_29830 [Clostridiales bacterium]|nr:hypothetical protein [Clostridiales bacterium]